MDYDKDEIYELLFNLHPKDLKRLQQYVRWVQIRRMVNNFFYFRAHWIQSPKLKAHWAGNHGGINTTTNFRGNT